MTWYIIGAGRSGLAAARLLAQSQKDVVLFDDHGVSDTVCRKLRKHHVRVSNSMPDFRIGSLSKAEGLVLSPSVSIYHPLVHQAKKMGVQVLGETEAALKISGYKGLLLGVTGTNGKSTTVALTEYILRRSGIQAFAAGNIGIPVSDLVISGQKLDCLVLELSSYQLEQWSDLQLNGGAFLNFSEDHLMRHKSMQQYFSEKWKLASFIVDAGTLYIHEQIRDIISNSCYKIPDNINVRTFCISDVFELPVPKEDFFMPEHNRMNAFVAAGLASVVLERDVINTISCANGFCGLSHRCELIGEIEGHQIINDSKSTNIHSTRTALRAFRGPVILMLGGQDKGESWKTLLPEMESVCCLITFGESGEKIAEELNNFRPKVTFLSLHLALKQIRKLIQKYQGTLLFSPGCASFDEFTSFEDRGKFFRESIHMIMKGEVV